MKAFFVVCFAVAALAESDPNLVYTTGYHSGLPLVNSYFGSPLVSALSPVSYIAQPTLKIVKDEQQPQVVAKMAEDKPEELVYKSPVPTTQYINQIQYLNPFQALATRTYIAKNGEVEHRVIQKRDAEADPWTIYNNNGFLPGFYNGVPTVAGVVPTVAGVVPSVYGAPAWYSNKATFVNPFTGDVTGKVTNDAITNKNYAGKGTVYARAPGTNTVHIAKRDAEAEPYVVSPYRSLYNYGTLPLASSYYYQPNLVRSSIFTPTINRPIYF